ncbi:MAG: TyeA family type III secretion system gatekeeper subunit, partial [Oligoflexales bacterium]|nr:TyeA family type III secretion system gatekeeper subunit [Oligoflexales bacterium]
SKEKLLIVIGDMYKLKVLKSIHFQCLLVLKRMRGADFIDRGRTLKPLMAEVLRLQSKQFVSPSDMRALCSCLGVNNIKGEINFFRELREIFRQMPVGIYRDLQTRQLMLDSVQECLDGAIEREELASG